MIENLKWYTVNFSNEQVIQGETTQFLRFKNNVHNLENVDVEGNERIWILPIPEIVGIDIDDTSYKGQVFFNGADVFEIQKIFKDSNNYYTGAPNFFIYGGPSNPTISNSAALIEEFTTPIPNSVVVGLDGGGISNWIGTPLNGLNTNTQSHGEKLNYRIDYKGNKNLVVKITFIITTANPNITGFFSDDSRQWPVVLDGTTIPKPGDIRYDNNKWEVYNGDTFDEIDNSPTFNPVYGVKHLHEMGYFVPGTPSKTESWLDFQESYIFCYKQQEKETTRDKDYWIDKELSENKIYSDKHSYALMRTNPKLSGNIKIVVDSEGEMYMDSIEANDELSNAKYKKNKLSPRGSFPVDVNRIFGGLSPEILYDIKQKDDQYLNTKGSYNEQYDFFYSYGASHLNSKYYDESNRLFAPLWIRKELPEFFVIFKVPGPINISSYEENDNNEILNDILKSASIVSSYDMREGSNLGTYLRKIVNDKRFEEVPLRISYEPDTVSTYFGVAYKDGIMTDKGEYLYDLFVDDHAINDFEEYITNGFQRNGMISTNLINLEFLFDDNTADSYEINRYFGLYVNEIELANLEIDPTKFKYINNQFPLPLSGVEGEPYTMREFKQTNVDGVVIPINDSNVSGIIPSNDNVSDVNRFFYIKNRYDKLQRIKDINHIKIPDYTDDQQSNFTGIKLFSESTNISDYTGITKPTGEYKANLLGAGNSQLLINFEGEVSEGEVFEIEWTGLNKEKQLWQCIANSNGLQPGDAWDYPQYNPDTYLYTNTFSPEGSSIDRANALATCLNMFENKVFTAWADGANVYIKSNEPGVNGNAMEFRRIVVMNSDINAIKFYGINPDYKNVFISSHNGIIEFIEDGDIKYKHNTYNIEIVDIHSTSNISYIKFKLRRNGGLLGTYTQKVYDINEDIINYRFIKNDVEILFNNDISIYSIGDIIELEPSIDTISQKFVGGSKRNRARASIDNSKIDDINTLHWFQTQRKTYTRLLIWDIQGEEVYALPDLEQPIYDNNRTLIGYSDYKNKSIIQISDENRSFYSGYGGYVVSVETYRPSIGMLSFLPVKDFDFDWVSSDYSYSPTAEVLKYFEDINLKKGDTYELLLNSSYKIEEGEVKLEGWDSISNKWQPIFIDNSDIYGNDQVTYKPGTVQSFNTYLPNYYYETKKDESDKNDGSNSGIQNHFYRNYKQLKDLINYTKLRIVAEKDSLITNMAYDADTDLESFSGFLGLSDFFSHRDEEELEAMIKERDTSRFFFDHLVSEYDRLRENFNKDYAVKSRVVPYINKWVQTGTDCRDNKYRLNNSMAFGVTNFSPDTHIRERNPRLHTHEFYYLDNTPSGFPNDLLSNTRSYFFDGLDTVAFNDLTWYDLLKDNTNDWFSKYFTVGYPVETLSNGDKIKIKTDERYVFTDFVPGVDTVEGIFRGGKFKIIDIDEKTNNIIEGSHKYVGYKFASILRIKRLSANITEPPTELEFISNDKYKTIVLVITLYVSDYRITNGYDYLFLYAGVDALRDTNMLNTNYIEYNESISNYVDQNYLAGSSVQRHFNEFQGGSIITYTDIKLSGIFNTRVNDVLNINNNVYQRKLNAITLTSEVFSPVNELHPVDGSDYDIKVAYNSSHPQIDVMERGTYSELSQYVTGIPAHAPLNNIINNQPGAHGNSIDIDSTSVTLRSPFNNTYITSGRLNTSAGFPTRRGYTMPSYSITNKMLGTTCWYLSGGKDYIANRLRSISYGELLNKINNNDKSVKYYTVTDDGVVKGNYRFELIDFDRIDKKNRLHIEEDIDKPDVFSNIDLIGFDVTRENDTETLYRHRGRFEPKTRDVIYFWARESEDIVNMFNTDYLLSNTRWATELNGFGVIRNLYYSKISEGSLMKISTTSEYKSLYPLIDEVAIDHKDFFIFNSNWDYGYYDKYTTRHGELSEKNGSVETIKIEGTSEMKEQTSFFGSKIMTVPNRILIDEFVEDEVNIRIIKGLKSVDNKALGIEVSNDTLPESNADKIEINIETNDILIRKLIESGATAEFMKLRNINNSRFSELSDDEIIEEAHKYIIKNVLPLYKVSNISVYTKKVSKMKDIGVVNDINTQQKIANGFKLNKNTNVNNISSGLYQITDPITPGEFKVYSLSITFTRI